MQPDDSQPVAGASDQVLAAVAGILPALPNVRADVADRFAQGVRALIETRAQAGWPGETAQADVAAFVFVDRPREVGDRFGAVPVTDPVATHEQLLGRIFFMNRDASTGRGVALPVEPGALIDWLADNGLGDRPLVMIYRTTKIMTTRRTGVDGLARPDPIRSKKPNATLDELTGALNYFHLRQLTPSSCADGLWEPGRASDYVPGPAPEKVIQEDLEIALNFWFHGVVKAEIEDKTAIGRIDVRLLKKSGEEGALAYWAIIELKVIKSFANAAAGEKPSTVGPAANIDAIVKGLKQAWAYRENRSAEEGLLEVFDLRKDKKDDLMACAEVTSAIGECAPTPTHAVRPLFGSADDARTAGYAGV
jgi:hypothetical protein